MKYATEQNTRVIKIYDYACACACARARVCVCVCVCVRACVRRVYSILTIAPFVDSDLNKLNKELL